MKAVATPTVLASTLAENRALYLPAISKSYAVFTRSGAWKHAMPIAPRDLDFLDPASPLFHYPLALYSAGQAAPVRDGALPPCMVTQRDRAVTIVLGDSGGYQVMTGVEEFVGSTPRRMMRWMERVADLSMVLDFPTGGVGSGVMARHRERLESEGRGIAAANAENRLGLDYNACLVQTRLNNDYFVDDRTPGATRFLNVLQGRTERESRYWYESVKHYPFEGWAFAGANQNRFSLIMARLLDMRDDGILERCDWLHVLGVSTLEVGVLLTVVQRLVRETTNPRFQISFDSSSPFQIASTMQMYTGSTLDATSWDMSVQGITKLAADQSSRCLLEVIDAANVRRADRTVYRADTGVANRVTLGDLRAETGTGGHKATSAGYWLLMNHNVQALLDGHHHAHQRMFEEGDPLGAPLHVKTIATMLRILWTGRGQSAQGEWEDVDARELLRDNGWTERLDALRRT